MTAPGCAQPIVSRRHLLVRAVLITFLLTSTSLADDKNCAPILALPSPPVSNCFEVIRRSGADAMRLLDTSSELPAGVLEMHASFEQFNRAICSVEEQDDVGVSEDGAVFNRRVVVLFDPVLVGESLCKIKANWQAGLDEHWANPRAEGQSFLVRLLEPGTHSCKEYSASNYVLLEGKIPDMAVASLLSHRDTVIDTASRKKNLDADKLCVRSIGVGERRPFVHEYYFSVHPNRYLVYGTFAQHRNLTITDVKSWTD